MTEGLAGTENQCLGIADALALSPVIKRIQLRQPWKTFSPLIGFETASAFCPPLSPPWPDLLISSGRKSIAASRYIKKASRGNTFTVQVQDPRIDPGNFDLVVVPAHDPARGKNVFVTMAAPNRINSARLAAAKESFPRLGALPAPRVAVLIGGDSRAHRLTPAVMRALTAHLERLGQTHGLMITVSRRTSPETRALLQPLTGKNNIYVWDGTGENPYFAMLAWADFIIVTADSVSMLSEAATTGKPVYMVPLEGGAPRLNTFHRNLLDAGIIRIFDGKLEYWRYQPLGDAQDAAEEIKKILKNRL